MRRGYSSSRPATDLPSPPKGPAPGASDELELRPEPEGIEYFDDLPLPASKTSTRHTVDTTAAERVTPQP